MAEMELERVNRPKAAVFVDVENQSDLDLWRLMRYLRRLDVVEKRAFADWRNRGLDSAARKLEGGGFQMHHTRSGHRPGTVKNTADGTMAQAVRRMVSWRPEITAVVLVSGDSFFIGLARELKAQGKWVIVAADPRRVSKELSITADEYLPIGELARSIEMLHRLEQINPYLTLHFVIEELGMRGDDLAHMIERKYLFQGLVPQPPHGVRHEIWLNRRSRVVQSILRAAA